MQLNSLLVQISCVLYLGLLHSSFAEILTQSPYLMCYFVKPLCILGPDPFLYAGIGQLSTRCPTLQALI
uniref:PRO1808 n=1 Tax=Homo sapiens TaxID=9606 RepID=Q9UHT6_HUMAN|nr:PRO1808 [Homo sapiens]